MRKNQNSYKHLALLSRTGILSAAHRTLLTCHSLPSFDVPTVKKCLDVNAASHAHRDLPQLPEPETLNPALLCRKMPIAPPQPLSPLRCPPRSTDLSILSRSLTRPREAGQGGRGGRRREESYILGYQPYPPVRRLQTTLHIIGIPRWRLSCHASSCHNPISISSADVSWSPV